MKRKNRENIYRWVLFLCALMALIVIVLITGFICKEGLPIFSKYGLGNMFWGESWHPTSHEYGLWPMITGTIYITLGSLLLGVPLGVLTAIFLAEIAPHRVSAVIRPAIELLAGIPSVIYGLFGMTVIVPFIRNIAEKVPAYANDPSLTTGYGIIACSVVLSIMILPTIINISEDAIRSVPLEYKEGSLALGATHWQTIAKVIVPAASSGINAGVVLGMGRAIGETMAVIMVAGNSPMVAESIFSSVRSLTGNIAIEMAYSSGEHTQALFATGVILFVFIMLINSVAMWFSKRSVNNA